MEIGRLTRTTGGGSPPPQLDSARGNPAALFAAEALEELGANALRALKLGMKRLAFLTNLRQDLLALGQRAFHNVDAASQPAIDEDVIEQGIQHIDQDGLKAVQPE